MGYRRPHSRRAHMRTNSDGSKSYVSQSYVKGHEYNRKNEVTNFSTNRSYTLIEFVVSIVTLIGLSSLILLLLGWFLMWETLELLMYGGIFVVCLIIVVVLGKKI